MYILGISCFYHDSAACLIKDGLIIAAFEEEKFSRKKHDESFPLNSIEFCLKEAGISIDSVDKIVFYDKPLLTLDRIIETYIAFAPKGLKSFVYSLPIWVKDKIYQKQKLLEEFKKLSNNENEMNLYFSSHHYSHAASAFFPSPFESAAILCVDGVGEWATTSLWTGKGKEIKAIKEMQFPHSLGLLYSAFTYYCGFKVNDGEYKLMGLAPYGEPLYVELIKEKLVNIKDDGSFSLNLKYFSFATDLKMVNKEFEKLFQAPVRAQESEMKQIYMDIAASVQKVLEEIILLMVKELKKVTGEDNLVLAGGVALNCVANGKISESKIFENIWIQPASSDAGGALGAAFAGYYEEEDAKRNLDTDDSMLGSLLGPKYSDDEIENFLRDNKISFEKYENQKLGEYIADQIVNDLVIGWFNGRGEFGPRALGSRSIIGNATSESMQRTINEKIKFRESFRPFAPMVLEKDVKKYFKINAEKSPYMLLVAQIEDVFKIESKDKKEGLEKLQIHRSKLQAITHVDYSARIQTINEKSSLYQVVSEVDRKIGFPVIINTSFNVRGEPIVNTPEQAYNCFVNTKMDLLVLNNFVITEKIILKKEASIDNSKRNTSMSKVELKHFLKQLTVFLIVIFYITLPFFGVERTLYPLYFCIWYWITFFIQFKVLLLPAKLLKNTGEKIHSKLGIIILTILYFMLITPISILIRAFKLNTMKTKDLEKLESLFVQSKSDQISRKMY